jgi:hypothetical protein
METTCDVDQHQRAEGEAFMSGLFLFWSVLFCSGLSWVSNAKSVG